MRILICDDEIKMANMLGSKVRELVSNCEVHIYNHGSDLWNDLQKETCDVLLLDIDMPEISGMDIASRLITLDYEPLLVFITSHDELVYDSLKFHPFGFIRKNYLDSEFQLIIEDCIQTMESKISYFAFRTQDGNTKISLSDIFYFESDGNYIRVYTKQGEYRFRETMTSVQNTLENKGFIRIHKGFLVNQEAVKVLGREEATLVDNTKIPIGRSYADTAKKMLMRYII